MKNFEKILTIVTELRGDVDKFYTKENQAAGTRIRKAMQEIKSLAQEVRMEVQEKKNSRPS